MQISPNILNFYKQMNIILHVIFVLKYYISCMFQLHKTIVSESILENDFACNLSACKGACCVDGDAGAPLEQSELGVLHKIYPKIKSYLTKKGIQAIEDQGVYTTNCDGEFETH